MKKKHWKNGDKGGNGGIPAGVIEKEHEEMKEREREIKKQGTKKRRRDRRTTA